MYKFCVHPERCVEYPERLLLRRVMHPFRYWYGETRRTEQVKRQNVSWWKDLRREVRRVGVPGGLSSRITSYLTGFVLVRDWEDQRSDFKKTGRVTSDWRRQKRFLAKMNFDPNPTTRPPQKESLRTRLVSLMEEELFTRMQKRDFCGRLITPLWALINEVIARSARAQTEDMQDETIARIARRSRRRNKLTK
jgi:hypothetical protein